MTMRMLRPALGLLFGAGLGTAQFPGADLPFPPMPSEAVVGPTLADSKNSWPKKREILKKNEALGLSQLRGERRQEVNATRHLSEAETEEWSEGGPVKCLCKDSAEMYFCAESFEGFSKCSAPCPNLCEQKGGRYFMCGGGHEILWLDRYFKNEERNHARCPKSKKK
mmetsp:Transcript_129906/g.183225  ORF Transcript_129906/g.183225 Transcript_129906/m.183225 type:complete len:167 (-) Transcript_129906:94-594(-)